MTATHTLPSPLTTMGRSLERLRWRLAYFSIVAFFACLPMFESASSLNDFRDAQILHVYEEGAVRTVADEGALPLWNPWYCGGLYGLGTPQSRFASPTFLLSLVFGTLQAQALIAFLLIIFGMEGFYRYAKTRTQNALGCVLAAGVFAVQGLFATSYHNGWIHFFGFEFLPWAMLGIDLSARGRFVGVIITAATFAFMVGFGGTYAAPIAALLCGVTALRSLVEVRRTGQPVSSALLYLICAGLFAAGASAFRLWPVFETLASAPRILVGSMGHAHYRFNEMLFSHAQPHTGIVGKIGYMYLGVAPVIAAIFGLLTRRSITPLTLGALFVWAAAGYDPTLSLFALIRELPVFGMLRYPERLLLPASIFLLEIATFGVDKLVEMSRNRRFWGYLAFAPPIILLLGTVDSATNMRGVVVAATMEKAPVKLDQPFRQSRGNRWLVPHYQAMNLGSLSCMEAYPVPMSDRLRGDLPQEEYLDPPTSGTVERLEWTSQKLTLNTMLTAPARLMVNQNWHHGWRSSAGTVVSDDGLLAVDLPAGDHHVILSFLPRSAVGGSLVSLATWIGLFLLWRKKQHRWSMLVVMPLIYVGTIGLTTVFLPEPSPGAPVFRNANGLPLVVDVLPADVTPVSVDFGLPIRLEGVRLPKGKDEADNLHFELYFRVTGKMPESTGVYVHIETPKRKRIMVDHALIGTSVIFANAPQGVLLRDAFSIPAGKHPQGTWRLFMGLWEMTGNKSRIAVKNAVGVSVNDDRIDLGSFVVGK